MPALTTDPLPQHTHSALHPKHPMSSLQAFVIPGLLGLGLTAGKHLVGDKLPSGSVPGTTPIKGNGLQKVMAAFVLVMGLALFGNGIIQRVVA